MKLFRAKTTHPWEKNSPVFENRDYLNLVYEDLMKNQYIKTASASSRVKLNIFFIKIKLSVFLKLDHPEFNMLKNSQLNSFG